MKQTHYLTTTVQKGNRVDISLPSLPVGQTIEVILIVPETAPNQSSKRQAFRQLPIEERRRILTQQAEAMKEYYQEDEEGQPLRGSQKSLIQKHRSRFASPLGRSSDRRRPALRLLSKVRTP